MSDRREPTRAPDRALGRALRGLPRERAADGFTRRVLDRLDSTDGSPVPLPMRGSRRFAAPGSHWSGGLRWAAASALAAVALAVLVALNVPEVDPGRIGTQAPPRAPVADTALRVEAPDPEARTPLAAPEPIVTPPPVRPTPTTTEASPSPEERRSERLAALDAERARIARELAEIRRLAHEPLPVVYVGGDETVDFVVDLQSLSRMARLDASAPEDRTLRPNGYTIEDPERNER